MHFTHKVTCYKYRFFYKTIFNKLRPFYLITFQPACPNCFEPVPFSRWCNRAHRLRSKNRTLLNKVRSLKTSYQIPTIYLSLQPIQTTAGKGVIVYMLELLSFLYVHKKHIFFSFGKATDKSTTNLIFQTSKGHSSKSTLINKVRSLTYPHSRFPRLTYRFSEYRLQLE